jgi:putative DNA primase/helicase
MISMSERVAGALAFIKDADDRETWIRVGMAIKSELGKDGYDLWLDWSRKAANFDENAARVAWESFRQGKITIGTLFYLAKQSGWQPGKYQKLAPEELERLRLAAEEAKA